MPARVPRVLCVGECMAELVSDESGGYRLGFGGDTLNTALYMARLLGPGVVGYVTRLGDDPYSARMRADWEAEGIDCALVETVIGTEVGLYAIDTDQAGERSFTYWRSAAPARQLFTHGNWRTRTEAVAAAEMCYLSGITLAILPEIGRQRLIEAATDAKARGALVAVDPNFRPRLWRAAEAAGWVDWAYAAATVALTSAEEEDALASDHRPACAELVMKAGSRGAEVNGVAVVGEPVARPVDTTGAGDAFDAAYLSARLKGLGPEAAAAWGCRLGARVVSHRGAILPSEAMADLIEEFAHASQ